MKINEFTYPSSDGIHQIHAYECIPQGEIKGIIQICHGVSEHFGRYSELYDFMAQKNILVCGNDYLGHGKTALCGELGHITEKNGWDHICNDIAELSKIIQKKHPNIPYCLFGHSMGSFAARTVYMKNMVKADKFIFSGTGHQNGVVIKAGKLISSIEAKKMRSAEAVSPIVLKLAFGPYNKGFEKRTQSDWISSIPSEVDRYESDELCGKPMTIALFMNMLDGLDFIRKQKNYQNAPKQAEVLLVSGSSDPVGNKGKGVKTVCTAMLKAGIKVKNNMYEGRHELLHDTARDQVLNDICSFVGA